MSAVRRARPGYRALLAVHPDGALTEVLLTPGTDASPAVLGLLDCVCPRRVRLTSRLDMWGTGDRHHSLPGNILAAGIGLRHGLSPRCYHGTVLLCGTASGSGPAGLDIDQVLAVLTQIADIADEL